MKRLAVSTRDPSPFHDRDLDRMRKTTSWTRPTSIPWRSRWSWSSTYLRTICHPVPCPTWGKPPR